jgi:hypothetical protein
MIQASATVCLLCVKVHKQLVQPSKIAFKLYCTQIIFNPGIPVLFSLFIIRTIVHVQEKCARHTLVYTIRGLSLQYSKKNQDQERVTTSSTVGRTFRTTVDRPSVETTQGFAQLENGGG